MQHLHCGALNGIVHQRYYTFGRAIPLFLVSVPRKCSRPASDVSRLLGVLERIRAVPVWAALPAGGVDDLGLALACVADYRVAHPEATYEGVLPMWRKAQWRMVHALKWTQKVRIFIDAPIRTD